MPMPFPAKHFVDQRFLGETHHTVVSSVNIDEFESPFKTTDSTFEADMELLIDGKAVSTLYLYDSAQYPEYEGPNLSGQAYIAEQIHIIEQLYEAITEYREQAYEAISMFQDLRDQQEAK
jgi:hypothetical protein